MSELKKKKVWHSKEWENKRDKFIKDKVCEWCGSSKILAIHHANEPVLKGLKKWKSIMNNTKRQKKYQGLTWEELKPIVDEKFAKWKKKYYSIYENFDEAKLMVLCNRCHYALHKGKVLCKVCKKNYHGKRYDMCYECKMGDKLIEKKAYCGKIIKQLPDKKIIDFCLKHCRDKPCEFLLKDINKKIEDSN